MLRFFLFISCICYKNRIAFSIPYLAWELAFIVWQETLQVEKCKGGVDH